MNEFSKTHLTPRELEILRRISETFQEGEELSHAAISNGLGIASDTLRAHKRNIEGKFGSGGQGWWNVIKLARQQGFLTDPKDTPHK